MKDLFAALESILREGESLVFKISRSGSNLTVLLIPSVPSTPGISDSQVEQARAALSLPLRFEMTGAELDAEFSQRLSGFAVQRGALRDSYELLLCELREANKATLAKATAKSTRGTAKTGSPLPEREARAKDAAPKSSMEDATDAASTVGSNAESDMNQPLSLF